jgi:hypothetical protein
VPTGRPPPFVSEARPDRWAIEGGSALGGQLRKLGFRRSIFSSTAKLTPGEPLSFEAMGQLAAQLHGLGVAFGAGRDWSPSDVVQQLRQDGLFEGSFTEIAWTGEQWHVRIV